ncbi:YcxB family protein [Cellulosilyticum ruminicola]|uniref:YcxB family protein n=1 Tax=Cellulosilyticum ruminicola TaxID=425254 RepID=UPI0006D07782|nr:YcxB family protein [Cellulosilyticum ruminicola]
MIDAQKYTFYIIPIDIDELLEQISFALEKRMELISRERFSQIWTYTDKLNTKGNASETFLKKRNNNKNKFIKSAKQLLQVQEEVIVDENQIELKTLNNSNVIQYQDFEYIIETEDAFLLTYQGYVTILQKKDLHENEVQDFCDFISSKVKLISLGK